jgi:hypothetical protein
MAACCLTVSGADLLKQAFEPQTIQDRRRYDRLVPSAIGKRMSDPTPDDRREFFAWSDSLDRAVLRPLSNIKLNWELMWDHDEKRYQPEEGSFAGDLNALIDCISAAPRPDRYHDNEDVVANYLASQPGSTLRKEGGRWKGDDYFSILERGGFRDIDQRQLRLAAVGRVCAAIEHGQRHFDEMEEGHREMLAIIMTIILYHSAEL